MRSLLASLLILGCVFSACTSGYILNSTIYNGAGYIRLNYQLGDANTPPPVNGQNPANVLKGFYTVSFNPSNNKLTYKIVTTLPTCGAVTLNGPADCPGYQGATSCAYNTAPALYTLGTGTTQLTTTNQAFSGSITLSTIEVAMLFDGELYIEINTLVTDPTNSNNKINSPLLRGAVNLITSDMTSVVYYHSMGGLLDMEPNKGQFGSTSGSNSQGLGVVIVDPTFANAPRFIIFSTIHQPGVYYLKCDVGSVVLFDSGNPNGQITNAIDVTFNFANPSPTTAGEIISPYMVSELLIAGRCYIFVTSAQYPNGDLYSAITPFAQYQSLSLGSNQPTPVSSAYYALSFISFDYGAKTFTIFTQTNLTATNVISMQLVSGADNVVLCSVQPTTNGATTSFPNVWTSCYINATDIPSLVNGSLYINIATTAHTSGELRGTIVPPGGLSGSNSLAIGLGVGLGIGIPVAVGAGVGAYFLVKKGGVRMPTKGKI